MKIIDGRECRGGVDTLLELEEPVEVTPDGFRAVQSDTLEAVAARLRDGSTGNTDSMEGDNRLLRALHIQPFARDDARSRRT